MKLWNQRTHKGRKFYRLNHGGLSKDQFYLSYYRILHTSYLSKASYCIPTIKSMFLAAFGVEMNAWSQYYMMDTEKCFVNDDIINNLNHRAVFQDMNVLQILLVELGFDVYLLQCLNNGQKPDKKSFYQWLPIKKSHKLKKIVKLFWKERLPKGKLLQQLGIQLQAFTTEIASVYHKLLVENDVLLTMTPQRSVVLASISLMLEKEKEKNGLTDQLASTVNQEFEKTDSVDVSASECTEGMNRIDNSKIKVSKQAVEAVNEVMPAFTLQQQDVTMVKHKIALPVNRVKKVGTTEVPNGRGFCEKKTVSAKKAVTCAVCVAAAGALLLPLVAYSVMKQK